jgi:hypothetical protein
MLAIPKKIVLDARGKPRQVIISWAKFRELSEALGLDLDETARRDLKRRNIAAFKPLSEF